jgi:hypothetical protein
MNEDERLELRKREHKAAVREEVTRHRNALNEELSRHQRAMDIITIAFGASTAIVDPGEQSLKIEFSFRYGVIGIYRDRNQPIVRVYPVPFMRITFATPSHV